MDMRCEYSFGNYIFWIIAGDENEEDKLVINNLIDNKLVEYEEQFTKRDEYIAIRMISKKENN